MSAVPPHPAGHRPALASGLLTALTIAVLTAVLSLVLAACSGDDGDKKQPTGAASRGAGGGGTVATVTTIGDVSGGQLGEARRQATKKMVSAVVDDFLDGAYLGSFPRSDFGDAFQDFTPQAAKLAEKQLDVLTNQPISDQISSAAATKRRVRLTVFAPKGLARGITARFVLDFTTAGDLREDQRVQGQLYLQKPHGKSWQVFGFKVNQPVTR